MPDLKITDLTADTTPTSDDLVATVNDPLGTPANRKVTLANLILGLGGAWTAYTPTITAQAGTFTSVSATGKYIQYGKTIIASGTITITTNGTAATNIVMTLPATAKNSGATYIGSGRANSVSGKQQQIDLKSSTTAGIWNYDGTYGGATGETVDFQITYEAA